ncbi:tRNA pseudouridine(38-40) synthase TruA [Microbacterium allomyrinae]|uniref:tRNA pseudouridine synthase A n=1 Tax=Microbacterium allomyrinae TaxID=2830666 RepID=A0A9X1S5K0_9MICO|nr:tRNA pseudouridine(38-40) synthase TruA [Microbacterium allomyrinae]MCC2034005.1 tRNA pseudouridine(38-40) synthase TruA [Microbacterium allomyrinae]
MRIRLDIAYDGTHFRGWARQPGHRTVQETLEAALGRVLGGAPRLVVAGRTDAGVHASGQVAHVDLDDAQRERLLARRMRVPDAPASDRVAALAARVTGVVGAYSDVAVIRTAAAAPGFDARFSAVWRRYEYRIADAVSGYDPLERHRTTTVRAALDEKAMDAAARSLIGLHDFAAYCKPREEATTIRTLLEFDWRRDAQGVLVAHVRADAFCHSMVRALVGASVAVGEGRLGVDDVADIRDARERVPEVKVLAARGLTLSEVGYPADDLLAQRAEQTRGRRTLD